MDALGINGGFLVAQIVNFGVILLLMGAFAWRPLTRALDNRAVKIAQQLEDAEVAAKARANAEVEAESILDGARRDATKFADEARGRGDEAADAIIVEARQEAEQILADARERADVEVNAQLADLRDQVAGLAIAATNKLVGESLTEQKQRTLVNDFFTTAQADISGLDGTVEVVSALPLTDAEQAQVKQQTGANEVSFRVDPSVMGGLVVRAGDRVIDGSVRSGLRDIAARLN